jgi:hypothetical protein
MQIGIEAAAFLKEAIEFISDLASGDVEIEDARKRAAELQAKMPEQSTDALQAELDARLAELNKPTGASER